MPNFTIKSIENNDIENFCDLLMEIRPPIAGLTKRRIYQAISREAIKKDKIIIILAKEKKKIVGFTIAIIDWKIFWKNFLLLHPIITVEILMKRIFNKI
jgi:hypothetical protein